MRLRAADRAWRWRCRWPAARAYVGPGATIVSASLEIREQGDDASTNADLSADGRYVVFDTRARNLYPSDFIDPPGQHYAGGVMRRDLQTGRARARRPGRPASTRPTAPP